MRWLAAAVLVAVSALLIVRAADGSLLREGLAEIVRSPRLVAVLLGAYAAAFVLRALAWRALLGRAGPGAGVGRLVAILHAALFANHALPVKAGEVLRPALAARGRPDRRRDRLDGGRAAPRCRGAACHRRRAAAADDDRRRGPAGACSSGPAAGSRRGRAALDPFDHLRRDAHRDAGPRLAGRVAACARGAAGDTASRGAPGVRAHGPEPAARVCRRLRRGAGAGPRTLADRCGRR